MNDDRHGPRPAPRRAFEEILGDHMDALWAMALRLTKGRGGCRRFVDEMREMKELVRGHAPRPEAPSSVRERVFRAVARERLAELVRICSRPMAAAPEGRVPAGEVGGR